MDGQIDGSHLAAHPVYVFADEIWLDSFVFVGELICGQEHSAGTTGAVVNDWLVDYFSVFEGPHLCAKVCNSGRSKELTSEGFEISGQFHKQVSPGIVPKFYIGALLLFVKVQVHEGEKGLIVSLRVLP